MIFSAFRAAIVIVVVGATAPARAIINGVEDHGASHHSAMVLNDRGGLCTGVFIDAQTLLTAAHCVAGTQARVLVNGAMIVPLAVARHPRFNGQAIQSRQSSIDLALLRLPDNAGGHANMLSASPPPAAGSGISALGFGLAEERSPATTGRYRRVDLQVAAPYGIGKLIVWAQRSGGGVGGACQGDSGGPMLNRSGQVVAIISWSTGHNGAQCGHYTQGILVAPHRAWIDSTLAQWGAVAQWR